MKKLIIVCEERLRKYGDFLAQLISRTDDTDNMIVGVKDGAAVAQVWTEKEYTSNAAQISSEQYILFIGNTNLIKIPVCIVLVYSAKKPLFTDVLSR